MLDSGWIGKDFMENVFDKFYVKDNLNCFNGSISMRSNFVLSLLFLIIVLIS